MTARLPYSPVSHGFAKIETDTNNRLITVTVTKTHGSSGQDDVISVHMRCKHVNVDDAIPTSVVDGQTWTSEPATVFQLYPVKTVFITNTVPPDMPSPRYI